MALLPNGENETTVGAPRVRRKEAVGMVHSVGAATLLLVVGTALSHALSRSKAAYVGPPNEVL